VMGWHATFVGTLFIALATTFPEMVVTVTALRLGALDMAIGNLFGSNLFNILIVTVDDAFFRPGPVLSYVSPLHAVSAVSAMMMTGLAVVGLLYRPATRLFGAVSWLSLALLTLCILVEDGTLFALHPCDGRGPVPAVIRLVFTKRTRRRGKETSMQRSKLWTIGTFVLTVGIGLGPFAGLLAAQKDVLVAKKTTSPPTLDGHMEDVWQEAPPLTVKVLGGRNLPGERRR